ncbi:ABC transporter, inner membrane subunit [Nitrosococcus oceani ATCC 19707]|uniref:ABC transporter, inner membrane subunit n=2 Tax=Nitrosococcus oceani TaxID=1229 RepID=Q3JCK0_NITOC|nr:ABC transporter permease [Nitrosococcus oceani]ABA57446.1 ABC transporter, inner membrane subunit [Nitrosococcus oceani ATCC 19707]EDZ67808.1 ABC transporter, permease protein [Nitrosococcus oceani AFC27]KFI20138.1 peptide ABC transporter permease [Nitrosococcus oceani C-27]GEM21431.1 peptide ABC transporter permease [Nitrosococcus oceani]
MSFQPVFLWTDILIYLLLALLAVAIGVICRRKYLRAAWKHVLRSRRGQITSVILLAYALIGLLDSVHLRQALTLPPALQATTSVQYSSEVLSLLDLWVFHLREQIETTYSAPFATHLYTKALVTLPDGEQLRAYPRLKYGGVHLVDPAERWRDITQTVFLAGGKGLFCWLFLTLLGLAWLAKRRGVSYSVYLGWVLRGSPNAPWRVACITVGIVLIFAFIAAALSQDYHIFGTNKVGQDVFYQSLKSIRTGLVIGTLTTLVMLPLALMLGIVAGYFRGWIDDIIQYIYTTLNSIPGVLLIAAAILMLEVYIGNHPEKFGTVAERADLRLLFLCLILGVTSWTGLCRILRGETLKLREADYVLAAQAFGVSRSKILLHHILPNVMHIVLISVVLDFSGLVLAEAVLSYVGVGVDPSTMSWGNMINSARLEMAREPMVWWSLTAAFLFMFILVLAANLFSDVVREALDPRMG